MKHRRKSAKYLFFPFFANSFHNLTKPKPIFIQTPLPSISVCMIVCNEEHCLAQCLESVRDLASEIILVDTGSTDRTVEIAQKFGAKVIQTSWNDHYAEARNLGLAEAMGDWVMILDADEVVSSEAKRLLPAYLRHYQGQDVVLNWRVCSSQHPDLYSRGLFSNHRGIEFAGRVHEVPILPGKELSFYHCQDLVLWHESQAGDQEAKLKYYQQLLEQNLVEETEVVRMNHVQKHLGLNHLSLAEWSSAWKVLSDCYQGMQELGIRPTDGFYGEVLRGLVHAGLQLGHQETRRYALELKQYYPLEPMARDFRTPVRQQRWRTGWRKGMVAVTMSLLAACQPASTVPNSAIKPLLLSQDSNEMDLEPTDLTKFDPSDLMGEVAPKVGDFGIKFIYFCETELAQADACYNSGGTPVIAFDPVTGLPIRGVDNFGNPCNRYDFCLYDTPQPTPVPTPVPPGGGGGSGGGSGGGGKPLFLSIGKPWFSPNGDGVKDDVQIQVTSSKPAPWLLKIKKGGTVLKTFTGTGNTTLSWDGAEALGKEGKYQVTITYQRRQNVVYDQRQVGLDLTAANVDFKSSKRPTGSTDLKVVIKDVCNPTCSGPDQGTVQINPSSANLTIDSGASIPSNATGNRLAYDLVVSPTLFSITSLFHALQVTGAVPPGPSNGDTIKVSGSDVAGVPFNKESPVFVTGAGTMCTTTSGSSVSLSTNPDWFSVVNNGTSVICTECPSGTASVPKGNGERACKPFACDPNQALILSPDGHSCVQGPAPCSAGGFSTQAANQCPKPKAAPKCTKGCFDDLLVGQCSSQTGGSILYKALDIDRTGPDVTLVFGRENSAAGPGFFNGELGLLYASNRGNPSFVSIPSASVGVNMVSDQYIGHYYRKDAQGNNVLVVKDPQTQGPVNAQMVPSDTDFYYIDPRTGRKAVSKPTDIVDKEIGFDAQSTYVHLDYVLPKHSNINKAIAGVEDRTNSPTILGMNLDAFKATLINKTQKEGTIKIVFTNKDNFGKVKTEEFNIKLRLSPNNDSWESVTCVR